MELTCNKCHLPKPVTDFTKCKPCSNGVRKTCKSCTREYMIKYEKGNITKISNYNKQYRLDNIDKQREYMSEYNRKPEVIKKKRAYYDTNIQYYRDIEKTEARKQYRYMYNKTSHIARWRTFLANTLTRLDKPKEGHTIDLLGYSAIDLKKHLENLFTDGMSWSNYCEWHIDHIIPLYSFETESPICVVNALSNLQPLWATTREINGILYEGNLNKNKN